MRKANYWITFILFIIDYFLLSSDGVEKLTTCAFFLVIMVASIWYETIQTKEQREKGNDDINEIGK
jgi:Na+-translocating ferredoxin:NAD+ oxidoreductase RnfA subunit